jgi:AcrR family transcriptional regulator
MDMDNGAQRHVRGSLSRDRVLDIAVALMNARGYDRTSMNDIAAALGISKPAVYHYFASKEDILTASIERGASQFEAALALHRKPHGSAAQRLEAFIEVYARALNDPVFRSMALVDERVLEGAGKVAVRRCKRVVHDRLEGLVAEAIAAGEFVPGDARAAARAIFGMFNGVAVALRGDIAEPVERLLEVARRMLHGGLVLPAPERRP